MPDDRDKLNRPPPPPHVAEQIAAPLEKRASTNTDSFDEDTPVLGDPVQQINKRAQAAAGAARGAWGAIREVRAEVKESHRQLNDRVDKVSDRMSSMQTTIGDIKGVVGEISGQMKFLVEHHKATQTVEVERTIMKMRTESEIDAEEKKTELEVTAIAKKAEIEITTQTKKLELEETKEERAHRRKKTMWFLGAVGSLITALAGLIAAVKC